MKLKLNLGYSSIFASYWMVYGVVASFCSAFLLDRGYSNSEIGVIMAVASAVSVFMQPLLGDWADRSKKLSVIGVSEVTSVIILVLISLLYIFKRKSVVLWVIYVLILAWELALQPLLNSLCFKLEESGHHVNFGICRAGGSLGYALLVAVLGTLVEKSGVNVLPTTGVIMVGLLLAFLILTERTFKRALKDRPEHLNTEIEAAQETEEINLLDFVRKNKIFVLLCVSVAILFFQNSITNNFMLQIVQGVGGDAEDMGRLCSVMAASEIPGLFFFDKLNQRFGAKKLLVFSSIMFIVKMALMWVSDSVGFILYLSQTFNMLSFGIFLPAMVVFIGESMEKGEAVKGQALYTAFVSVSGIFASVIGGIILDFASSKFLLFVTVVSTVIGTLLIAFFLGKINNKLADK